MISMNPIDTRLLLAMSLATIAACFCACSSSSQEARGGPSRANPGAAGGTTRIGTGGNQPPVPPDRPVYPYQLVMGSSVNHVEQEAEGTRLKLKWVRWSDSTANGTDGVFRVTNPGTNAVLVWNVRQEVRIPRPDNATAKAWDMRQSDYPGRGWERAILQPGESVQFPVLSPGESEWRVCLLYSREMPGSEAPNRRFDRTFESISPNVREDDLTESR